VSVSARLGEANLLLPRSFRGPLRISATLGEVSLSKELRAATRTFGDGRMLVGTWKEEETDGAWTGDEAIVDAKMGSLHVGYEDEDESLAV
jgi:hypothetical protein